MKAHRKRNRILLCLGVLTILLITWIIWSNFALETSYYTISNPKIPDAFSGFRIVQISDLHNAQFGHDNEALLKAIENEKPDMIVITGDLVDSRNTNFPVAERFAAKAAKIAPTYYITGNHEARLPEYPELEQSLIRGGVTVLNNEAVWIERKGEKIQLIGLQDPGIRKKTSQISGEEILKSLKEENYTILLSHDPGNFPIFQRCAVDLALTGHVHGGQFRIPFIGGLYAPGQGLFPKYDAGLYRENQTQMIISRGLGNSAFPFRINNRPEIVVIELKSE